MNAATFRVTTQIDLALADDIEVLETAFPDLKGKQTDLMKKAFELAARVMVEAAMAELARKQSESCYDDDEVMAAQLD